MQQNNITLNRKTNYFNDKYNVWLLFLFFIDKKRNNKQPEKWVTKDKQDKSRLL